MKHPILLLCLILGSQAVHAAFHDFNWFAEAFVLRQDSVDTGETEAYNPIAIGDGLGGEVLFALYFTPGASTQQLPATASIGSGPVNWSGFAGDPGGDDRLVQVVRANEALSGGINLNFSTDFQGNTLSSIQNEEAGFFYSVAFQFNSGSVNPSNAATWNFAVPENTFAYITQAISMPYYASSDIPSPAFLSATAGGTWIGEDDGTAGSAVANTVLIPEPGTLLMALITGITALGFAAFSRQKS